MAAAKKKEILVGPLWLRLVLWRSLWGGYGAAFSAQMLPVTMGTESAPTTVSACLLALTMRAEIRAAAFATSLLPIPVCAKVRAAALTTSVLAFAVCTVAGVAAIATSPFDAAVFTPLVNNHGEQCFTRTRSQDNARWFLWGKIRLGGI